MLGRGNVECDADMVGELEQYPAGGRISAPAPTCRISTQGQLEKGRRTGDHRSTLLGWADGLLYDSRRHTNALTRRLAQAVRDGMSMRVFGSVGRLARTERTDMPQSVRSAALPSAA